MLRWHGVPALATLLAVVGCTHGMEPWSRMSPHRTDPAHATSTTLAPEDQGVGDGSGGEIDPSEPDPDVGEPVIPAPGVYVVYTSVATVTGLPELDPVIAETSDDLLFEVRYLDPPTLALRLAPALESTDPPVQNVCVPTVDATEGAYDGREFAVPSDPVDLGLPFPFTSWELYGRLKAEDPELATVALNAVVDVQALATALGWDPGTACDILAERGIPCSRCGDSACALLKLAALESAAAPDSSIEYLTEGDVETIDFCI